MLTNRKAKTTDKWDGTAVDKPAPGNAHDNMPTRASGDVPNVNPVSATDAAAVREPCGRVDRAIIDPQYIPDPPATLGSLFDGIGAAPLAASYYGIKALWASEILPAAISVTKRRFPDMVHLGDVRGVDGGKIPPVDIIMAGTPCQDISIANSKRLGLAGSRSSLFLEAIRIVKEMREATHGQSPRFFVWENVAHALGVNNGRDFQTILSEIAQADVPMPLHGKWAHAGLALFDGSDGQNGEYGQKSWEGAKSVAYRLLDSQFWGTAQRRVRCFAVADYRGASAGEICFKPDSLLRYLTPGGAPWERLAANPKGRADGDSGAVNRDGVDGRRGAGGADGDNGSRRDGDISDDGDGNDSGNADGNDSGNADVNDSGNDKRVIGHTFTGETPRAAGFMAGQAANARSIAYSERVTPTLKSSPSGSNTIPTLLCMATGAAHAEVLDGMAPTLTCHHEQPILCEPCIARTLTARGDSSPCADRGQNVVAINQNQLGEVRVKDVAYTLNTNSNASGRNAPLVAMFGDNGAPRCPYMGAGLCVATAQANAETSETICPTITEAAGKSGNNKPYIVCPACESGNCLTPWDVQSRKIYKETGVWPPLYAGDGGGRGYIQTETAGKEASAETSADKSAAATPAEKAGATNCLTPWDNQGGRVYSKDGVSATLAGADMGGGRNVGGLILTEGDGGDYQKREALNRTVGTLCASGAGLSRTGGQASEPDFCVVQRKYGSNGVSGDSLDSSADCPRCYCLQSNMIGRADKNGPQGSGVSDGVSFTITSKSDAHGVAAIDCRNFKENGSVSATLAAKETGGYSLNYQNPLHIIGRCGYIVRRLLPIEAERLMAFPPNWTERGYDEQQEISAGEAGDASRDGQAANGKPISDSRRYSLCGNSIVVTCLSYFFAGIAEQLYLGRQRESQESRQDG